MSNLTKREIVLKLSNKHGIKQQVAHEHVQLILDTIADALAEGRDVELRNFGVFEIRLTRPRVGRNPKSPSDNYEIPSRAVVKFKAGKAMRQRVLLRTHELEQEKGRASADAAGA